MTDEEIFDRLNPRANLHDYYLDLMLIAEIDKNRDQIIYNYNHNDKFDDILFFFLERRKEAFSMMGKGISHSYVGPDPEIKVFLKQDFLPRSESQRKKLADLGIENINDVVSEFLYRIKKSCELFCKEINSSDFKEEFDSKTNDIDRGRLVSKKIVSILFNMGRNIAKKIKSATVDEFAKEKIKKEHGGDISQNEMIGLIEIYKERIIDKVYGPQDQGYDPDKFKDQVDYLFSIIADESYYEGEFQNYWRYRYIWLKDLELILSDVFVIKARFNAINGEMQRGNIKPIVSEGQFYDIDAILRNFLQLYYYKNDN